MQLQLLIIVSRWQQQIRSLFQTLQNILNNVNPTERKKDRIIGNSREGEIDKHQNLITLKVRRSTFVVLISWASDEAQSWGRLQLSEGSMISLAKQSSGIADISAAHPDQ